mgnify:FL=1
MERLDKFISNQTGISRADVKKEIRAKRVAVGGIIAKSGDMKIDPETDVVTISGKEITYKRYLYIMMNKPAGYVCSTDDNTAPTVIDLLPDELKRKGLFPAGRLDKDTEGFVLITDDGEFAHDILSPSKHVAKKYLCRLEKKAEKEYENAFKSGIIISGGEECKPALIEFTDDENLVYLTIFEGKFHQIKRMFEAVGNRITYLKRLSMGGLFLDENLALGECREILHKEIEKIKS